MVPLAGCVIALTGKLDEMHASIAVTNLGGILSQGLRIAPSEAPASGYAFGKEVYLADIISKSANYCHPSTSVNTGQFLLCGVELGSPTLEMEDWDRTLRRWRRRRNVLRHGARVLWDQGRGK
ncbi:hypothetical protein MMC21_005991 [Puttea exsequens]|nr:hypothetical protein [Puttea exsequens]